MARITDGVRNLVLEVLATLPTPHGEDVIRDVALAIENSPAWRSQWDSLVVALGEKTVRQALGSWVMRETGMRALRQVDATGVTIIRSYSKLTVPFTVRPQEEPASTDDSPATEEIPTLEIPISETSLPAREEEASTPVETGPIAETPDPPSSSEDTPGSDSVAEPESAPVPTMETPEPPPVRPSPPLSRIPPPPPSETTPPRQQPTPKASGCGFPMVVALLLFLFCILWIAGFIRR